VIFLNLVGLRLLKENSTKQTIV